MAHAGKLQCKACARPSASCAQVDETVDEATNVTSFINLSLRVPGESPLSDMPCGLCPVMHECAPGNDVSPENCRYMAEWLDF